MTEHVDKLLSDWLDSAEENTPDENDLSVGSQSEAVAESLLIHGLLTDISRLHRNHDADPITAVMRQIDSENRADRGNVSAGVEPHRSRKFALVTSAVTIAAALMIIFELSGPRQTVSAANDSLEKVVEASARPLDRTYIVRVVEEYDPDKRPRNLPPKSRGRETGKQIDGAILYVRGANQYVMTTMLSSGEERTVGCDGRLSWAVRETGPVHVSTNPDRFRGGVPGQQQGIPFLNVHAHLSLLQTGYRIELGEQQDVTGGAAVRQLTGVRKSRDVRGPRQIKIWFHAETGTVQRMVLDGLPRGRGGPKTIMLNLIDQSKLDSHFFFHDFHHEPGRRIINE